MPFKSEKQRRYLWATQPDIAKRWAHKYPESNKGLPMYANKDESSDSKEKKARLDVLGLISPYVNGSIFINTSILAEKTGKNAKKAADKLTYVDIPHSDKPTYAGQEREEGEIKTEDTPSEKPQGRNPENAINSLLQKLSVVLSQPMAQMLEDRTALEEGREPAYQPRNPGIRQYSAPVAAVPPPMGMQTPTTQQPAQPQPAPQQGAGMNSPSAKPIQSFGPLSASGNINGNAAFGQKNSPDSLKTAVAGNSILAQLTSMNFDALPPAADDDLDIDGEYMKKAIYKWAAYNDEFKNLYGIDARFPHDYSAMRQMGVAASIGGLLGLARGTFWPGYHEKLDESGNVIAKKRRSPWLGAAEGALIGAGTSALSNYAGQTLTQYNPEIDRFLSRLKDNTVAKLPVDATKMYDGVDVGKNILNRVSTLG